MNKGPVRASRLTTRLKAINQAVPAGVRADGAQLVLREVAAHGARTDPVGQVHDVIDVFVEAAAVAEVRTSDVETLFVRFGDVLGNACGLSGLVLLLASFAGMPGRRRWEGAGG